MPKHEILFLLGSYLLGSIPFGFIIFYLTERKDIRSQGSGNIGATNVLRTKGKSAGIITLLLDMAKGLLPVLYGLKHFDSPVIVISGGAAVVIGHLFPAYIKFKGGKGVASFVGVLMVFHFPTALVFGATFFSVCYFTRCVSAGSIAAVTAVFFFTLFTQVVEVSIIMFMMVILIILKHHGNIRRLATGTENQLNTE
ncbi:MAG: glycerol-3-phosphate 1-O-acyltransferase PlsY [bacterium]|nr:glycerol-3-phosphate 1-O-acyltransferase PlsY [bacterium]